MSIRPCNLCLLRDIRARAKESKDKVTVDPDPMGSWKHAVRVSVHPKDVKPTKRHFVAWFATVSKRCTC